MDVQVGKYYVTRKGWVAHVSFTMESGKGFYGTIKGDYQMPRWWNKNGMDSRNEDYDLMEEASIEKATAITEDSLTESMKMLTRIRPYTKSRT